MTDNSKGELIKKKTENVDLTAEQQKKKVIVKKVKKVVVKKSGSEQSNETHEEIKSDATQKIEKEPIVTDTKKREDTASTQHPSTPVNRVDKSKSFDNRRDDRRDDRKGNFNRFNQRDKNSGFDNRRTDQKFPNRRDGRPNEAGNKPFVKRGKPDFEQKDQHRDAKKKIYFKSGDSKDLFQRPVDIQNDKERARKKLNNKKNDILDKREEKGDKKEDYNKAFVFRKQKETTPISAIPGQIDITDVISISDLAKKMNLKASVLISKLMELGTMATINDKIDAETAEILCSEFNCKVNVVSLYDETVIEEEKVDESQWQKRAPIVTVMGHVDHGKTKLLDAIRHTNVVAGEAGGITQHIGAYSVVLKNGERVTFIDTPGHEAFTTMRARGANVTDIVVLVVAADDGVMPQTIEAINHAKAAKVPIIVAVNKVDKETANPDRVKQQLVEYDLLPEEWGGHTLYVNVSALKKIGIEELLDTIILQAEVMDLKAPYNTRAKGFVLETKIEQGRGVVSTVLITSGTLKVGDFFVAGVYAGKVRAIYNDRGEKIDKAVPSTPVEITGLEKAPNAGDPFNVTESEKIAKMISSKRMELNKLEEAKSVKKLTIKELLSQQQKNFGQQELKIIIKADVHGSVEALKDSLEKLSTDEIKITIVSYGVGAINESDIRLAVASRAIIVGFHVRANVRAAEIAEKEKIEIRRYNIIYDVIEDIKAEITGMIKPDLIEEMIGTAEVKQVFKISKVGTVAGCVVTSGKVRRDSLIRLIRDDVEIYSEKISTLKRFKDEASEVSEGMECGIAIENFKDIKENDILEAYIIKEIARNYNDIKK